MLACIVSFRSLAKLVATFFALLAMPMVVDLSKLFNLEPDPNQELDEEVFSRVTDLGWRNSYDSKINGWHREKKLISRVSVGINKYTLILPQWWR